jgi:hypothetical protein
MMEDELFASLKRKAQYALNCHSKNYVYEAYGMALMAWQLKAITHDQYWELNTMLVRDGLNNPAKSKLE